MKYSNSSFRPEPPREDEKTSDSGFDTVVVNGNEVLEHGASTLEPRREQEDALDSGLNKIARDVDEDGPVPKAGQQGAPRKRSM
jgi:hypothetical protein